MDQSRLNAAIAQFLAARPLHPCCLLVHHEIQALERASTYLAEQYHWPVVSIGTVLSAALREIEPNKRPGAVSTILSKAVGAFTPGPVLCTDTDILFELSLRLDPLRLLRELSRLTPLVVGWAGKYSGGILTYASADPPHAHYRAWRDPGLCPQCIISIQQRT